MLTQVHIYKNKEHGMVKPATGSMGLHESLGLGNHRCYISIPSPLSPLPRFAWKVGMAFSPGLPSFSPRAIGAIRSA